MPHLTIEQALQIGLKHHQAGQLAQAEAVYRHILAQHPKCADALHLLGLVFRNQGRNDVAVDLIRRAIALNPSFPEAHCNLGNALRDLGQLDEAAAAYRQALALKPDFPEAHNNLGNVLRDCGELEEAIAACGRAVALRPDFPEAQENLAIALMEKGQLAEAIAACRRLIALTPDRPESHLNLGNALKNNGQVDEAIASYLQATALRAGYAAAYSNLGAALTDRRRPDEAIAACRRAIALAPALAEAHNNLGMALKDQGQIDGAIAAFRQAIACRPGYCESHSNLVHAIHFHPDYSAQHILEQHRRWNHQHAEPLKKQIRPWPNSREPERRLRIGYISPDLRRHSVGRFLLPLLANHDKEQLEVFAYAQVARPDEMTERLRAGVATWRNIVGLSDARAAELIRQDQIDILVDLAMHTAGNRLLVFARKPAPVQATYLAYCSTTGLDTIDYRLSDPYLDPPGADESCYSERTIRLPETYWCYQADRATSDPGPPPALAIGHVTFGCLNNFCKVSEPALATWAAVLKATPDSHLLLHAHEGSHRQRVQERLEREGIAPNRLHFVGTAPMHEYLDSYRRIDIALDTFPHGGGTTTCDALWMGVPVVSLVGRTAVGRGGLSILANVGLPELAARSEQEYVRIAVDLARDLASLKTLRAGLRTRMQQSPLMDAPHFARCVESAYRQMWRNFVGGR